MNRGIQMIQEFYHKYHRNPNINDEGIPQNQSTIHRKLWVEFGVTSWYDLLVKALGAEQAQKRNIYYEREGLEFAIRELQAFEIKNQRKPTSKDRGMRRIYGVIERKKWAKFGILSWNDLMQKAFDEVNREQNIYLDEMGLQHAIKVLQDFHDTNGRKPTVKDKGMAGILSAIHQKRWAQFGAHSWNDLLRKTFGTVNKEYGIYVDKQGLKRAITELQEYFRKHHRQPVARSPGMNGIHQALQRKRWVAFGISSWRDLLSRAFNGEKVQIK